jgi:hypothetical protein
VQRFGETRATRTSDDSIPRVDCARAQRRRATLQGGGRGREGFTRSIDALSLTADDGAEVVKWVCARQCADGGELGKAGHRARTAAQGGSAAGWNIPATRRRNWGGRL